MTCEKMYTRGLDHENLGEAHRVGLRDEHRTTARHVLSAPSSEFQKQTDLHCLTQNMFDMR